MQRIARLSKRLLHFTKGLVTLLKRLRHRDGRRVHLDDNLVVVAPDPVEFIHQSHHLLPYFLVRGRRGPYDYRPDLEDGVTDEVGLGFVTGFCH